MSRAGAIGSQGALSQLREFLSRLSYAVPIGQIGKDVQPWKMDFPGLGVKGPLGFDLYLEVSVDEPISVAEGQESLIDSDRKVRIEASVMLYEQKFKDLVTTIIPQPEVSL